MVQQASLGHRVFTMFNYTFLTVLAFSCIFPIIHLLAVSFSSASAVASGEVALLPVDFTVVSYLYVFGNSEFWQAFLVSVERVLLGMVINMLLTVLLAYPLSKEVQQFRWRTIYAWFFVFTMLFSGGLIPWYMVINELGLLDSIWALVMPAAVPVFNVILMLNFFRGLPKELDESAKIDGAGHWTIMWRIVLPLSLPSLATVLLFTIVGHWNSWFDGLILMNDPGNYPLQSYLRTVVVESDVQFMSDMDIEMQLLLSDRTNRATQVFIAMLPILAVYPLLQRFFVKGIVLGSVKE
ncbi:carbohydrate ABC transporter permease [Paenibacillus sp. J5C_2022]|uniref:carbohydrate ABC transporter permease n=1 Tax=Paenibacillus sp. J5C2022 TaxID=2977129 RepID=UPI0021D1E612|nr:carbohydrate ABC transporter permease [Paenibacillus sp. J5C2022]MCU6712049.1 carbohydrate ABC transporter permease [Paenibacillus sp. J5C2022]